MQAKILRKYGHFHLIMQREVRKNISDLTSLTWSYEPSFDSLGSLSCSKRRLFSYFKPKQLYNPHWYIMWTSHPRGVRWSTSTCTVFAPLVFEPDRSRSDLMWRQRYSTTLQIRYNYATPPRLP